MQATEGPGSRAMEAAPLRHRCAILYRWLSTAPARLIGVDKNNSLIKYKGQIWPDYDADFAVWDPEAKWKVQGVELHHRHKTTPYDGAELAGETETCERLTFAIVASVPLSRSLASALTTAVPPVDGAAQPESFTASTI